MDNDSRNHLVNAYAKAHEYYSKAMEMVGIFSAGTIGVVVALRPSASSSLEIKVALILLFLSMLGTIFWFMGKGQNQLNLVNKVLVNPDVMHKVSMPFWARACRIISLAFFIFAYWLLYKSM